MIVTEKNWKLLNFCRFNRNGKTETRRIVASLPCVLYEELDGEACSYIEEALDFYTAKYKFESVGDEKKCMK